MRGKLTRTALTVIGLALMVAVVVKEGVALGAAVLGLLLAGIALIQVGAHEPAEDS